MLADLFKTKREELNTSIFSSLKATKKPAQVPTPVSGTTKGAGATAGGATPAAAKPTPKPVPKDPGYNFTQTFIPKSRDIVELKCKIYCIIL